MEMRFTKIVLKRIIGILAIIAALIAALVTVEGSSVGVLLASNCSTDQFWCVIEINTVVIVATLGVMILVVFAPPVIVDLFIEAHKHFWPRIASFFKKANPENIQIYFDTKYPRRQNEIVLTVENDEWRFNSLLVVADVLLLRAFPNDDKDKEDWKDYNPINKWEHLKWLVSNNSDPIELGRWQSKETGFIKIDNLRKEFYVDADTIDQTRLKPGIYQFIVKVVMTEPKLHIRNNFPSRYRLYRTFSIIVKYDGVNIVVDEIRDATNDEARY